MRPLEMSLPRNFVGQCNPAYFNFAKTSSFQSIKIKKNTLETFDERFLMLKNLSFVKFSHLFQFLNNDNFSKFSFFDIPKKCGKTPELCPKPNCNQFPQKTFQKGVALNHFTNYCKKAELCL